MTKTTKRVLKAQEQSKKQIAKTTEQLATVTKIDSIINQKAVECMTAYIEYGKKSDEYGKMLIELSTIICHCKLNTLLREDKTYRKEFAQFKTDVTISSKYKQMLETLSTLYTTKYNSNGDVVIVCTDKQREQQILKEIANLTGLDGSDLTSVCYLSLIEIINKAEQNNTISTTTLLDTFLIYNLTSKTYKNGYIKPKELWTQKATNGIKEANKNIARAINENRAIKEQTTLYTAIESTYKNEDGEDETVTRYQKAPLLSAYEITDMNGKQIATIADSESKLNFESIPQRAKLTTRESYILKWVYEGSSEMQTIEDENGKKHKELFVGRKSLQQIADEWGLKLSNVQTTHERLINKLVKSGIFANIPLEPIKNAQNKAKAVKCYHIDENGERQYITTYLSVHRASQKLNIDRNDIRRVINGKRTTAKGLYFEYDN